MTLADLQARLAARARHFSPFFVLGDPDGELSVELARDAVEAGASMLELGIPYRDPCADGPAVQRACARALAAGSTTDRALRTLARIRAACPGVPQNLLVYGNLVHARGVDAFCRAVVDVGASSLLVPDVPLGEDEPLRAACAAASLGFVRLVGPRTVTSRLQASSDGTVMLYIAGVQGVTGTPGRAQTERAALLARASVCKRALCTGFGITTAADVATAFAAGASVVVAGSRLADVIEGAVARDRQTVRRAVAAEIRHLAASAQPAEATPIPPPPANGV